MRRNSKCFSVPHLIISSQEFNRITSKDTLLRSNLRLVVPFALQVPLPLREATFFLPLSTKTHSKSTTDINIPENEYLQQQTHLLPS